jgi:hypothetical protein
VVNKMSVCPSLDRHADPRNKGAGAEHTPLWIVLSGAAVISALGWLAVGAAIKLVATMVS